MVISTVLDERDSLDDEKWQLAEVYFAETDEFVPYDSSIKAPMLVFQRRRCSQRIDHITHVALGFITNQSLYKTLDQAEKALRSHRRGLRAHHHEYLRTVRRQPQYEEARPRIVPGCATCFTQPIFAIVW